MNLISLTLTEISEFWNNLRNAAIGRGVGSAKASPPLAAVIEADYARWRVFYVEASRLEHMGLTEETAYWRQRYDTLRDALAAEKISVEPLPVPAIEQGLGVVVKLGDPKVLSSVLTTAALCIGAPLVALALLRALTDHR